MRGWRSRLRRGRLCRTPLRAARPASTCLGRSPRPCCRLESRSRLTAPMLYWIARQVSWSRATPLMTNPQKGFFLSMAKRRAESFASAITFSFRTAPSVHNESGMAFASERRGHPPTHQESRPGSFRTTNSSPGLNRLPTSSCGFASGSCGTSPTTSFTRRRRCRVRSDITCLCTSSDYRGSTMRSSLAGAPNPCGRASSSSFARTSGNM